MKKADKYGNALYKAYEFLNDTTKDNPLERCIMRDPLYSIFPELKELEEDRIRRSIEMILTTVSENTFEHYKTNLSECLDWLNNLKLAERRLNYE